MSTELARLLRQVSLFGEGSLNDVDRWRLRSMREPVAEINAPLSPEEICFDCPAVNPGEDREKYMTRCQNAMHGHNGITADVAYQACELTWNRREQTRAVAEVNEPLSPEEICWDCPSPHPNESEEEFHARCVNAMNGHNGATVAQARAACDLAWGKHRARAVVAERVQAARAAAGIKEPVSADEICWDCPSPNPDESRSKFLERCINAMHGHNGATVDVATEACELTWNNKQREQARAVATEDQLRAEVDVLRSAHEQLATHLNTELGAASDAFHAIMDAHEATVRQHSAQVDEMHGTVADLRVELAAARVENSAGLNSGLLAAARMAVDVCDRAAALALQKSEIINEQHEREARHREELAALRATVADLRVELAAARAADLERLQKSLMGAADMAIRTFNEATNFAARKVEVSQEMEKQRDELAAERARGDQFAAELKRVQEHRDFKFAREGNGVGEEESDSFDLPQFLPRRAP